jgi:hypothetical protein
MDIIERAAPLIEAIVPELEAKVAALTDELRAALGEG